MLINMTPNKGLKGARCDLTAPVPYLVPENVGERELVRAGNLLLLAEFLPALYYGFPISGVKGTEISHHTRGEQHIPGNVHQPA